MLILKKVRIFKVPWKLVIKFVPLHCLNIRILEVTKNFARNVRRVRFNVW